LYRRKFEKIEQENKKNGDLPQNYKDALATTENIYVILQKIFYRNQQINDG